jgi:hypothetical protein
MQLEMKPHKYPWGRRALTVQGSLACKGRAFHLSGYHRPAPVAPPIAALLDT